MKDLEILKLLLPDTYKCFNTARAYGINCISDVGLTDHDWEIILNQIKRAFGNRFLEVYHQVSHNHKEFTIYLNMVSTNIKKRFTNLVIIDASSSMESKKEEVIGGIKQLFSDIKRDSAANPEVETTTIVVDFASAKDFRELVNTTNPNLLSDFVAESYKTRGMTALYDAIGFAFNKIPTEQDGVFVNILTDGEENDSKEFGSGDVRRLIEGGKAKNWVITFMGTTESCLNNAISLGVSLGNTMKFTNSSRGVSKSMKTSNESRNLYYTATVTNDASFNVNNVVASLNNKDDEEEGVNI